jgi:acetyl esterase/lipase
MYLQGNGSELNMTYWENRPAVLVIPGGSYTFISQREGEPIALKFAAEGYQAFVLHYHTNSATPNR